MHAGAAALYHQAQQAVEVDDYQQGVRLLRRAADLDPESAELADALGALLAEAGPQADAKPVLMRAVQLAPDVGHEKYMCVCSRLQSLLLVGWMHAVADASIQQTSPVRASCQHACVTHSMWLASQAPETTGTGDRYLGQLTDGDEAVGYLSKGVALLRRAVEQVPLPSIKATHRLPEWQQSPGPHCILCCASGARARMQEPGGEGRAGKRSELASACCALAEKLMEGAPDVAAVQDAVEETLAQAREADAGSPEPLQVGKRPPTS